MKRLFIFIGLSLTVLIAGCGTNEEAPEVEAPTEEEKVEEEVEVEIEEPAVEEDPHTFSDVIEEYEVLSSFETDGPGTGLGLGMNILYQSEDVAFVSGHQGHALGHYRLLQVNHEEQKVVITHQFSEEQFEKYEELRRMVEEEGEQAAFEWMQNQESNFNELFFTSKVPPETTTVTWNDQEWEAIEVEIKDGDEKYVFAKGKGMIQIHYQSELAQELFGEIRVANRIED
ncbi:hypothetical protein BTR23_24675 [Alkalihalophilus pseudofirmus]|nr:hypothetical protein BTR23_24675 [Alkalihalophilus pseudofirmus]